MKEYKLKNRDSLLSNIADGLSAHRTYRLKDLEVVFHDVDVGYVFTVAQALDAVANDLYWDERGNWHAASLATVHCLGSGYEKQLSPGLVELRQNVVVE